MIDRTTSVAITVEHLSKRFSTTIRGAQRSGLRGIATEMAFRPIRCRPVAGDHQFWALDDVSFELPRGAALGVIGSNGAGKTTLLRILHGITRPDFGTVEITGRTGALIELGVSFDPSATGREAIEAEIAMAGSWTVRREGVFERVVAFADLGSFIDAPIQQYSSGMKMRLGYAIAAALEPEVLLIDEVISVGDVAFQRKCLGFIRGFMERGGSVVLASHDLWTLSAVCTRCMVLDHGRKVAEGPVDEVVKSYLKDHVAIGGPSETWRKNSRRPESNETLSVPVVPDHAHDDRAPILETVDPAELVQVSVCGVFFEPVDGDVVKPLGAAEVLVDIECAHDLGPALWGFSLTAAGHFVPLVHGQLPIEQAISLKAGRTRLGAKLDRLPLVGGTYLLRVVVTDVRGVILGQSGWLDEAVSIEVVERDGFERTLFRISGVAVIAELEWGRDDPLVSEMEAR